MKDWPFKEARNTLVFTTKYVVKEQRPVIYVSHDEDDGAWQFHSNDEASEDDATIITLEEMVSIDPSITTLHDLPEGWYAFRNDVKSEWNKRKR